jgi:hypothetical protein
LSKEDPNVPGIVLAAAPNNATILINDPLRQLFYIYTPTSASYSTYTGVGTAAQWTPDSKTLYIVGYTTATNASGAATYKPTLFVYNLYTGWTTYALGAALPQPPVGQTLPAGDLSVAIPGIGAFLSSSATLSDTTASTAMHAWCPSLVPGTNTISQAYPLVPNPVAAQTDIVAATSDGDHILGIGLDGGMSPTLTDITVNYNQSLVNGACPGITSGTVTTSGPITTSPVTQTAQAPASTLGFTASQLDQIVVSPSSSLAFLTYTAPAGSTATATLPYYQPTTTGALGTLGQLTFADPAGTTAKPTAPVAGVFSLDNTLFFVSTSGDNLVHYISVPKLTDTQQISPGLVDTNGNPTPATIITSKPRPTT